jgi:hypothetical protein
VEPRATKESFQMQEHMTITWRFFSSTVHTKPSLTTDGRPLCRSSCMFSRPSLKCLTHLRTTKSLMACSPYTYKVDECQPASYFFHLKNVLQTAFHMRRASTFSWTL